LKIINQSKPLQRGRKNSMKTPKLPSLTPNQFNLLEQLILLRESNHSDNTFSHKNIRHTIRSLYKRGLIYAEGRVPNPKVIKDPGSSGVTHFTNVNITTRGVLLVNAYKNKNSNSEFSEWAVTSYIKATNQIT